MLAASHLEDRSRPQVSTALMLMSPVLWSLSICHHIDLAYKPGCLCTGRAGLEGADDIVARLREEARIMHGRAAEARSRLQTTHVSTIFLTPTSGIEPQHKIPVLL